MAGAEIKYTSIPTGQQEKIGQRLRRGLQHLFARDFRNPHIPTEELHLYQEAVRLSGGRITEIVDRGTEATVYVRPMRQLWGMSDIDRVYLPYVKRRALKQSALAGA